MSLQKEKTLLESKIYALKRECKTREIEADMFVAQIREEASPYLDFSEIDTERLTIALDGFVRSVNNVREFNAEIARLEKLL